MKFEKLVASLILTSALMFAAFTPAFAQAKKSLTGVVSDQACGAVHKMKNMSAADCARACAKKAGWALVVGEKVYKLEGNTSALDQYAAEKVTVMGTLMGDTMNVTSVAPSKKS
jgi:hypothetical protein